MTCLLLISKAFFYNLDLIVTNRTLNNSNLGLRAIFVSEISPECETNTYLLKYIIDILIVDFIYKYGT